MSALIGAAVPEPNVDWPVVVRGASTISVLVLPLVGTAVLGRSSQAHGAAAPAGLEEAEGL